ncbi:MAG TPA: phospholipase D-like domain-containing protein, partial [Methanoregulaceae archaeon]|nr:phospholipase D-like domain-containing protein [Methanoregulaceae archaeon]
EMAGFINSLAAREGIPLEARCADLDLNNLEKIHNKGVIVDGRSVLVSSINWNFNSPNFNREVGVIITEPHTAAYFLSAFDDDWNAASCQDSDNSFDYLKLAITGVVILALVLLYLHRRR